MSITTVLLTSQCEKADKIAEKHQLPLLGNKSALTRYIQQIFAQADRDLRFMTTSKTRQTPHSDFYQATSVQHPATIAAHSALPQHGIHRDRTLFINTEYLPDLDVDEVRRCHRQSGADIVIFFDYNQTEYCHEHLVTDAFGAVRATLRDYNDSFGSDALRSSRGRRVPLVVVASTKAMQALHLCRLTIFEDLMREIESPATTKVSQVRWMRTPAVRLPSSRLGGLLGLIERAGSWPQAADNRARRNGNIHPHARISGAVLMGHDVRIAADAIVIGPTAIGDGVAIGPGAVISHCVVMPQTRVPARSCHHQQILGPDVEVSDTPFATDTTEFPLPATTPPTNDNAPGCRRLKQCFDFFVAAIGLVILAPVFAVIAIAIKWSSPGPVFYGHRRQGLGGLEFDCLKFRTMVREADQLQQNLRAQNEVDGPQFKIKQDPRITRIGRWLRRTNLDELPQLYNVLKGQMSLVGPRPSPDEENQYCPIWRKNRLSIRPGITGLWQVSRSPDRSQSDFQEWIYYDLQYIKHCSMWLDLQILWQTLRIAARIGPSRQWRQRWRPGVH